MADYIPLSPVSVDDPGTAEWANAVVENPIAIAEGAAGAPRIATPALKSSVSGVGVNLYYRSANTQSAAVGGDAVKLACLGSGSLYVSAAGGSGVNALCRRVRDSVPTTIATGSNWSANVSFQTGDIITITYSTTTSTQALAIRVAAEELTPSVMIVDQAVFANTWP